MGSWRSPCLATSIETLTATAIIWCPVSCAGVQYCPNLSLLLFWKLLEAHECMIMLIQVDNWWKKLLPKVAPELFSAGGSVIMVQVVNHPYALKTKQFQALIEANFLEIFRSKTSMDHMAVTNCICNSFKVKRGFISETMSSCEILHLCL